MARAGFGSRAFFISGINGMYGIFAESMCKGEIAYKGCGL
jgi:hypothetical protein